MARTEATLTKTLEKAPLSHGSSASPKASWDYTINQTAATAGTDATLTKTLEKVTLKNGEDVWFATYGYPNALDTFFLVHGAAGTHEDFKHFSPLLANEAYNVMAVDLPGHGLTSGDAAGGVDLTEARIVDAMIETVEILAAREPLRRFFLVGHSFGGATAMQIVARGQPSSIAGLALINTSGFRPHVIMRPYWVIVLLYKLLVASSFTRMLTSSLVRFLLVTHGFSKTLTSAESAYTFHRTATMDFDAVKESASLIHEIKLPLFYANARNDRVVEKAIGDEVFAILQPPARLEYDSGGHNIQKTRAAELSAALHKWAAAVPRVLKRVAL
ncbi:hypothetical protein LEN26_013442 [Aphanomyces euteiches]|nr:hypothetical protein LEN26_013442 [Aphanomyces euteiches]KAH9116973.1 hypothetical protein AeMF1_009180 [Aphanomyces euteiches]KAH9186260.1 hypothetical protein AeNC1_011768 [Aphanomyces euteiches]